jgi:serine/threonine protein kinase
MQKEDLVILEILSININETNKKEEIFKLDEFIGRYKSDEQYNDKSYSKIFDLLISRIENINESDYLHLLKILQSIRVMSRNKNIQLLLYSENIIKLFEKILEKLSNKINKEEEGVVNTNSHLRSGKINEIYDNIIIEILSIIKRFFISNSEDTSKKYDPSFLSLMLSTSLIDQIIYLLNTDNLTILKLIHFILIPIMDNREVFNKFSKTYIVELIISGVKDKNQQNGKIILDFILILIVEKEFFNLFMFLEGHSMIINKLRIFEKLERDFIIKILFLIQTIYKCEESLGDFVNSSIMTCLFNIIYTGLKYEKDFQIGKIILNILSAFALNDDLNILIRNNWLESLIKNLIDYCFILRDQFCNESDKPSIVINQTLIARILRLIFSLEKNRKYFIHLFPTKLLSIFIDIGNYKHSLNLYSSFIAELNSISDQDLKDIINKSINLITMINEHQHQQEKTIGGYSVLELIGKGGFGQVYKVKLGSQYFAMKEIKLEEKELTILNSLNNNNIASNNIPNQQQFSPLVIEKAISEIEIWKDLDHPNIVKYYTSFIEGGNAYILMELVEGVNLSEYISNLKEKGAKSAKDKDIMRIVIDIISGMKYLHKEKGILLRDVNPHNILIDNNFNVKLGDFGLAKRIHSTSVMTEDEIQDLTSSMSTGFVGSILYSSPEMIKNHKYTEKSDIWSLGCVIYELLCLSPPFSGDNPLTVAKNIVELNYKKINFFETTKNIEKLTNLVETCLNMDPELRPDINQLASFLGEELIDKVNFLKKSELELKIENDLLREKIYKLEMAFTTNMINGGNPMSNTNQFNTNNNNNQINAPSENNTYIINQSEGGRKFSMNNFNSNANTHNNTLNNKFVPGGDVFKQSSFKRISSDPLTKILDMINKIIFISMEANLNKKDEKYTFIHKFKKKLFNSTVINNPSIIKSEIMKLINFSKESINFEAEERFEPFNSTGMKPEYFKQRVTYEMLNHFVEELLIVNKFYQNNS